MISYLYRAINHCMFAMQYNFSWCRNYKIRHNALYSTLFALSKLLKMLSFSKILFFSFNQSAVQYAYLTTVRQTYIITIFLLAEKQTWLMPSNCEKRYRQLLYLSQLMKQLRMICKLSSCRCKSG